MGREVRMVPADWEHPRYTAGDTTCSNWIGEFRPMWDGSYTDALAEYEEETVPEWVEGERLWREEGKVKCYDGIKTIEEVVKDSLERRPYAPPPANPDYTWWAGEYPRKPDPADYMPDWPAEQRTHFMMYEDTSEGTPISPAFATPEELARWLADTGASAFADMTATYEQWLATIRRGSAHSATLTSQGMVSGVEALAETEGDQN